MIYFFLYEVAEKSLDINYFSMASRGIAASCRKVVCIGRNYAYALRSLPLMSSPSAAKKVNSSKLVERSADT